MTEPLTPQEPPFSSDRQVPQQTPPADEPSPIVPMSAPGAGVAQTGTAAQTGPYSELVGRPLTSDETMWSMLAHFGGILLGFVAPLIVMLTKGNESPYYKYNSVEALNFQITVLIGYVVASVLSVVLIGLFLFPVLLLINLIFCVLGGMAASKGQTYRYPIALRLVK